MENKKPFEAEKNFQETFNETRDLVNNHEGAAWVLTQELRVGFENESQEKLFDGIEIKTIDEAQDKAFDVISKTLEGLEGVIDLSRIEVAHGKGHFARDYIHAMILAEGAVLDPERPMDPRQAYVGIVAGALHDILGCALVNRYDEKFRAVRHAEAGAILFSKIADKIDVSPKEASLISYAIAAHTRYAKSEKVECAFDGEEREIQPYKEYREIGGEKEPIMALVLAKWADRFDVNGPCFVGRHFLTLIKEHFDYASDTGKFYRVGFDEAMRPLLRPESEIAKDPLEKTMREHLQTYYNSQNNNTDYGRFDYGKMAEMREEYKERLLRIIKAFDSPIELSAKEEESLLDRWTQWLSQNIEPSESGSEVAGQLREMFLKLPQGIKEPWFGAMQTTLKEYGEWSQETLERMQELPERYATIPMIGDIKEIISFERAK
jgi:hypothetical protein